MTLACTKRVYITRENAQSQAEAVKCALQRPEADLRNVQIVEGEVETASEDSGSPNSILRAGRFEAAHASLPWLTEWRLRLALTSPSRYQVLELAVLYTARQLLFLLFRRALSEICAVPRESQTSCELEFRAHAAMIGHVVFCRTLLSNCLGSGIEPASVPV